MTYRHEAVERDDVRAVNPLNGAASVLLIADDPIAGGAYAHELEAGGYDVRQATSFVDALATMPEVDIIVLCDLAVFAYPAQAAQVIRVPTTMTAQALVIEIHRRVALRATLNATVALAA
jgi:CheY-like chemotaxis protein